MRFGAQRGAGMIGLKAAAAAGALMGALAVGPLAYVAGDFLGGWEASAQAEQRAQVAELQAALTIAHQDLNAQREAAELQRLATEANRQAAAVAEERANDYEKELQARGPAGACLLLPGDIERLQQHKGGNASQARAAGG